MVVDPEEPALASNANLEGRYANGIQVGHNAFEFVLDFGQQYGGAAEAHVHTRIVTSPHYAKGFLETLQLAVAEYEREFGLIVTPPNTDDEDAHGN
jgi:hypothetical protein